MFTSVPSDTRPDSGRSTLLHLACLALFSLFLFSSTNGDIGVLGDDILFITHSYNLGGTYFNKIAGRSYLTPFYSYIYDAVGQSTQYTHIVYFVLFVASAFLLFFVLRKIFSNTPALIGSLFYLAYSGKYETVTWSSAGGYYAVILVLFLSVWIALSRRLNPWIAAILITIINWYVVHLYEILIVVSPLYPLLYLYYRWRRRKPLFNAALWPKFLPMLMFLTHWMLISLNTPKGNGAIWKRNPNMDFGPIGILKAVANAFWVGIKWSIGLDHYNNILSRCVQTFFTFVPHMISPVRDIYMISVLVLATVSLFICFRAFRRRPDPVADRSPERSVVNEMALITGLYLLFLSPLVYVTLITDSMASRFLILPSIGLAVLFALWMATARERRRPLVFTITSIIIFAEAFAFNSILCQGQTSWAYDSSIRSQMQAMNIHPKMGDNIQLAIPRNRGIEDFWRVCLCQYACGGAHILLLIDYNMVHVQDPSPLHLRLFYEHDQYDPDKVPPFNVPVESPIREDAADGNKKGTLYPFYLTPNGRLFAISQFNIVDGFGNRVRTIPNAVFAHLPPAKTTAMDVRAVLPSYPYVDQPRDLHFNFYDSHYSIRIKGKRETKAPPATAQLMQNGKVIDTKTLNDPGYFEWIIPLKPMGDAPGDVQLVNTEARHEGRKVGWSIQDINLIPELKNPESKSPEPKSPEPKSPPPKK